MSTVLGLKSKNLRWSPKGPKFRSFKVNALKKKHSEALFKSLKSRNLNGLSKVQSSNPKSELSKGYRATFSRKSINLTDFISKKSSNKKKNSFEPDLFILSIVAAMQQKKRSVFVSRFILHTK